MVSLDPSPRPLTHRKMSLTIGKRRRSYRFRFRVSEFEWLHWPVSSTATLSPCPQRSLSPFRLDHVNPSTVHSILELPSLIACRWPLTLPFERRRIITVPWSVISWVRALSPRSPSFLDRSTPRCNTMISMFKRQSQELTIDWPRQREKTREGQKRVPKGLIVWLWRRTRSTRTHFHWVNKGSPCVIMNTL